MGFRDPRSSRLEELASSTDQWVRNAVAWNRSTPVELLTRLAEDSDSGVRRAVAGNSSAPVELLARRTEALLVGACATKGVLLFHFCPGWTGGVYASVIRLAVVSEGSPARECFATN